MFGMYAYVPTESEPFPWSGNDHYAVHCRKQGNLPDCAEFDPSYEFEQYKKNPTPQERDKLQDKIEKAMLWKHNFSNDNHRWWCKKYRDQKDAHNEQMAEQQRDSVFIEGINVFPLKDNIPENTGETKQNH